MSAQMWKSLPNLIPGNIVMGEVLNRSEDVLKEKLHPKLLAGEIEVAKVDNVRLCSLLAKRLCPENGPLGLLVVTNFKLSFITSDDSNPHSSAAYQANTFLGRNDVTLANIDMVYQIIDKKKKQVGPQSKTSSKIEGLQIVCKNFRVLKFDFRQSNRTKGKNIADALAKFAFPNRHNLSFAYNFKEKYYNTLRNVSMFNKKSDWSHELVRCGAVGWRILTLDGLSDVHPGSLPTSYVVPKTITDAHYLASAPSFRDNCPAIWVFSLENAALVRMADLLPTITSNTIENTMFDHVRQSHPQKREPAIVELGKCLPSIQDVQVSYIRLRELFTPESARQFMMHDTKFYGLLEKSCWLLYVSLCLKQSVECATRMRDDQSVVIQENDGRDMCCIISSLVQLLLDPNARTMNGFQSLIQKDWVAMGHPFCDRLGHVINNTTSEQSPIFLLFLDCVWQLLQQYPAEFEFSETFLTTVWDSAFLPIFDTFQFNSEFERSYAQNEENIILRPVWDWGEQFADKDIVLFSNPLYRRPPVEHSRKSLAVVLPPNAVPLPILGARFPLKKGMLGVQLPQKPNTTPLSQLPADRYLEPKYGLRDLELWSQCYYRWLPLLEIQNGGPPQIDLFNRMILSNISKLQQALQTRDFDDLPVQMRKMSAGGVGGSSSGSGCGGGGVLKPDVANVGGGGAASILAQGIPSVNSFFPFSSNTTSNELIDILTLSSELLTEGSIFDALSLAQAPD